MKATNLIVLAAAVTVVGCGSSSKEYTPAKVTTATVTPITAGQEATLFPISVGNQWTYSSVSESVVENRPRRVELTITMEVKSVTPDGNGQKVALEVREGDVVKSTQTWRVDDTGVYQLGLSAGSTSASFTPPQLLLKFPVKEDETWEYSGTGPTALGVATTIKAKSINKGPQLTDTYAGQVSAYRVETTYDLSGTAKTTDGKTVPLKGSMISDTYFAPKLGMVRLKQTVAGATGRETVTMQLLQSVIK